ncbi:hypothetical protein [Streptomyces sp. S.PNR 29]|uniref:hypothetical protein n=1 Tax=Streptomyces sp. S.PNR 29 TaxID=2973805 RepID=UPI0025B1F9AC|nr:hypothetical protein [Streptomyces sp. S.PNR 29]MDN0200593.1 hypothetical protein [Streptomyces sp. S.PNR 29]
MVRCRWAAALVLLSSVLFLHLFAPASAQDGGTPVRAAVAADTGVRGEARSVESESAGPSCPGEEDASLRRLPTRSARTSGAAGTSHAMGGAAVRASAVGPRGTAGRPAATAPGPGAGGSARGAAGLQTLRC